jgi:hypothetical protein
MLADLLHGNEKKVWGDAGYQGQTETIQAAAPQAQNMTTRRVKTKPGVDQEQKKKNRTKSCVRAKVEWPFRILKRVFKYTKVRYRGIRKNHEWLMTAFALVNLYQHRKRLVPPSGVVRPETRNSLQTHENSSDKPLFAPIFSATDQLRSLNVRITFRELDQSFLKRLSTPSTQRLSEESSLVRHWGTAPNFCCTAKPEQLQSTRAQELPEELSWSHSSSAG